MLSNPFYVHIRVRHNILDSDTSAHHTASQYHVPLQRQDHGGEFQYCQGHSTKIKFQTGTVLPCDILLSLLFATIQSGTVFYIKGHRSNPHLSTYQMKSQYSAPIQIYWAEQTYGWTGVVPRPLSQLVTQVKTWALSQELPPYLLHLLQ